uniref:Predicted protein n=1 Tax=Hordeum vulgare subsp. vulgare TaxID=112509 RepID=F2EG45_HORVV|nr:predicted protein [Hordeum vulgare subsp. vulgare]
MNSDLLPSQSVLGPSKTLEENKYMHPLLALQ